MTPTQRIAKLDGQLKALRKKKSTFMKHESKAARAAEARRRNILGGWLIGHHPELVQECVDQLVDPLERAVFELPPFEKK